MTPGPYTLVQRAIWKLLATVIALACVVGAAAVQIARAQDFEPTRAQVERQWVLDQTLEAAGPYVDEMGISGALLDHARDEINGLSMSTPVGPEQLDECYLRLSPGHAERCEYLDVPYWRRLSQWVWHREFDGCGGWWYPQLEER